MSKSLFKDLLTQAILADEYATHKSETFTYTDEQLNKYYNENKDNLDSYEYRYCYVNADFPEQETDADGNTVDLTDEQKQTAMDGAKTKADSMLAAVQAGHRLQHRRPGRAGRDLCRVLQRPRIQPQERPGLCPDLYLPILADRRQP